MRLLWLIDSLTMGGAESLVVTFASAAGAHDLELTVCSLKTIDGNPIESRLRAIGVDVVNLGAKNLRDRAAFRRLLFLIRDRRIEIVHSHLTYASIWGSVASWRTHVPHVATLHTLPVTGLTNRRDGMRQWLLSMLLTRHAFRVVAVSQAQATAWSARGLLPGEKLVVITNAVEYPNDIDRVRSALAKRIGTVAVLREGKGIDVLLDAFRRVLDEEPETVLAIAGDGPLRMSLSAHAQELGLVSSIEWLGYRSDVGDVLASLDLFVHPSLQDALPTAVLEAMAAGVPVVASAAGGIPEIIASEMNGLLVPPGDDAALAAAILRMLRDDAFRHELADRGRETVTGRFSVDCWIESLRALYERAAEVSG